MHNKIYHLNHFQVYSSVEPSIQFSCTKTLCQPFHFTDGKPEAQREWNMWRDMAGRGLTLRLEIAFWVLKEGRTCQRKEEEQGSGRGVSRGQEMLGHI